MVALAVALSGYGLYQYVYEMPQTRARYEADPDRALREAGLWYPPGSPERERFEIRLQNREPIATFALTNSLAAFLAPWLVMLAGMACGSGRNRKRLLSVALCAAPHRRVSAVDQEPQRIHRRGVGLAAGLADVPRANGSHPLEMAAGDCRRRGRAHRRRHGGSKDSIASCWPGRPNRSATACNTGNRAGR